MFFSLYDKNWDEQIKRERHKTQKNKRYNSFFWGEKRSRKCSEQKELLKMKQLPLKKRSSWKRIRTECRRTGWNWRSERKTWRLHSSKDHWPFHRATFQKLNWTFDIPFFFAKIVFPNFMPKFSNIVCKTATISDNSSLSSSRKKGGLFFCRNLLDSWDSRDSREPNYFSILDNSCKMRSVILKWKHIILVVMNITK